MVSKRRFYKTNFIVEVLSDEPLDMEEYSLSDIEGMITVGHCSGDIIRSKPTKLNGKECARALIKQRSDPSFFQLDNDGNDTDEYEDYEPAEQKESCNFADDKNFIGDLVDNH
jgi:hypothetical protein